MAVDPKEKNEMARLITLMNEGVVFEDNAETEETSYLEGSIPARNDSSMLDPSIAAMKSILEAFNGSQSLDKRLADRSETNRELREALVTEVTDRGTRVGSWEIIINENGEGLKNFDVTNVHTGEPIASNLTVYDAALGIARYLNEGMTINSREIRDILNVEASYDSSRRDAANFKSRMETFSRSGNASRAGIMEARYVESLDKAKSARINLTKISRR